MTEPLMTYIPCFPVLLIAITTVQPPTQNTIVYREDGRFGGWPANNGIWCWGNEIVVGFTLGVHKDNPNGGHTIDGAAPQVPRLARSLDGGMTWSVEVPSFLNQDGSENKPITCDGNIDFTHPGFAFMIRMQSSNAGFSNFYWSNDRCRTWNGPFALPAFDRKGIFSRTDTIIENKSTMTAFLTAAKEDGKEGWPMCVRTTDGGKTWLQQSWIGPQPGPGGYAIMPSTVRLSESELFTFIRRRSDTSREKRWWIEPFRSLDNGKSWILEEHNSIDNAGNPPHMIKLNDGQLILTYGYRRSPFGIRARTSKDGGKTWSKELVLRDDAANWDLGYPRTVQRADGKLVTVYYFNDKSSPYRYIAATIWNFRE